jgi:hypothetical protein
MSRPVAATFLSGCILWLLTVAGCACGGGAARTDWPDSYLARVQALALLQTFNAELLSHDSATLTLERWCGAHGLASPPQIVAERVTAMDKAPTAEQRAELDVTAAELIRYRRVRLRCGPVVLSEADNWYVPGRLTAEMNATLDSTDVPFGKAVQALHFRRRTLSSVLLWSHLPQGWEMSPTAAKDGGAKHGGAKDDGTKDDGAMLRIPEQLLQHRAVLVLPDGTPFSEVVETYTGNVLAFSIPKP